MIKSLILLISIIILLAILLMCGVIMFIEARQFFIDKDDEDKE